MWKINIAFKRANRNQEAVKCTSTKKKKKSGQFSIAINILASNIKWLAIKRTSNQKYQNRKRNTQTHTHKSNKILFAFSFSFYCFFLGSVSLSLNWLSTFTLSLFIFLHLRRSLIFNIKFYIFPVARDCLVFSSIFFFSLFWLIVSIKLLQLLNKKESNEFSFEEHEARWYNKTSLSKSKGDDDGDDCVCHEY